MESDTNNVKVQVALFYDLSDLGPDRVVMGVDQVYKSSKKRSFCCAKCYDMMNDIVKAYVVNGATKLYGRHKCEGKEYCSKIIQKKYEQENEKVDVSKLKPMIMKAINEGKLAYSYRAQCCLINPEVMNRRFEKISEYEDQLDCWQSAYKLTHSKQNAYKDESEKGEILNNVSEIDLNTDYLSVVTPTEKICFLFNHDFVFEDKTFTILNVSTNSLYKQLNDYYNSACKSYIWLNGHLSNQNECHICPRCLEYNQSFLDNTTDYVPDKYRNKYSIVPEKSKFIAKNSIYYPEQIVCLMKKYNHDISLTHSNPITLEENTDNLYDLVYGLTFTTPLTAGRSYDFYEAMFLVILKQSPNHRVDEIDEITKCILKKGIQAYFANKDKTLEGVWHLYNDHIKPLLTSPEELKKKKEREEAIRRAQEEAIRLAQEEAHRREQDSLDLLDPVIQQKYQNVLQAKAKKYKNGPATWMVGFGKYRGKGMTYQDLVETDRNWLIWIYHAGRFDNEKYPSNALIKEYLETNLNL